MIIALSGIPGAGKDVIGEALREKLNTERLSFRGHNAFNQGFSIKKFATEANTVFSQITGVNYSKLPREEKEQYRPKFREFAEGMKEIFGQDIWAKRLAGKHNDKSNNWIITDFRFIEELKVLQKLDETEDVFMFRIRRICDQCGLMETHEEDCVNNNMHSVEVRLASYYGWNATILNDSTPEIAADKIAHYILTHYDLVEQTK